MYRHIFIDAEFLPSDITDRTNPEKIPNIAQPMSTAPAIVVQDPSVDVTHTADVGSTISEPRPSTSTGGATTTGQPSNLGTVVASV